MNALVENLTEADGDRFQNAEQAIEQRPTEIRIVNEVVRNAVDVPGNANRVDESENEHGPKRRLREQIEHPEKERAVSNTGQYRNGVPSGIGKNSGAGR